MTYRSLLIPLPGGTRFVDAHLPHPMSSTDWDFLIAVLTAMRPAFVESAGDDHERALTSPARAEA